MLLREYQKKATEEIVSFFVELAPLPLKKKLERVIVLSAPTGSGKTAIMKSVVDTLARRDIIAVVISPLAEVTKQNREAGLLAFTTQRVFRAARSARTLPKRDRASHIERKLGLPDHLMKTKIIVIIDESHISAENLTKLSSEAISALPGVFGVLMVTATPVSSKFRIINLNDEARPFVSTPYLTSFVSYSLLTVPFQARFFPQPSMAFAKDIISASVFAMALSVVVGNVPVWLACEATPSSFMSQFDKLLQTTSKTRHRIYRDARTVIFLYLSSLFALDAATKLRILIRINNEKKESLSALFKIVEDNTPPESYLKIRRLLRGEATPGEKHDLFLFIWDVVRHMTKKPIGKFNVVSIYKTATGTNLPDTSTIFSLQRSFSSTLTAQRRGRGSRTTRHKKSYDIVEVALLEAPLESTIPKKLRKNAMVLGMDPNDNPLDVLKKIEASQSAEKILSSSVSSPDGIPWKEALKPGF